MFDIPHFINEHSSAFRLSSVAIAKPSDALPDEDEDELSNSDDGTTMTTTTQWAEGPVNCPGANIANILFEKTNIPVPRVCRVIEWRGYYIVVVGYIKGRTLTEAGQLTPS